MDNNFSELEKSLNYKFSNINLLKEALSHPSLKQLDNSASHYERLEFLGDSILGFLISEMIFNQFTESSEGIIAKIKAHVVSSDVINIVAQKINLPSYIIMTSGEENSGGRVNSHNIENVMEALIAAIYLDSNINIIKEIVEKLWKEEIKNIDFSLSDPKTALQELTQGKMNLIPKYEILKREGAAHAPLFTIRLIAGDYIETATGNSIKSAEKLAATQMLKKLK